MSTRDRSDQTSGGGGSKVFSDLSSQQKQTVPTQPYPELIQAYFAEIDNHLSDDCIEKKICAFLSKSLYEQADIQYAQNPNPPAVFGKLLQLWMEEPGGKRLQAYRDKVKNLSWELMSRSFFQFSVQLFSTISDIRTLLYSETDPSYKYVANLEFPKRGIPKERLEESYKAAGPFVRKHLNALCEMLLSEKQNTLTKAIKLDAAVPNPSMFKDLERDQPSSKKKVRFSLASHEGS